MIQETDQHHSKWTESGVQDETMGSNFADGDDVRYVH